MEYSQDYFDNIRYPIINRFASFKGVLLKLIGFKESIYADFRSRYIVNNLKVNSSLDVGCSDGKLVLDLLKKGVDAYGLDISAYHIDKLNKQYPGKFFLSDAKNIPLEDESVDLVSAYHVLEHISKKDLKQVIKESARISNKYLLFEIPTAENVDVRTDSTHVSIMPNKAWIKLFESVLGKKWARISFIPADKKKPLRVVYSRK